jgi:hypothetical protein
MDYKQTAKPADSDSVATQDGITLGGKLLNKVSPADIALIETTLSRVGVGKLFHEYISELIECIMLNIVTKDCVPVSFITFDK